MGELTQAWYIEILYLLSVVLYISTQRELHILPSNRLLNSKKRTMLKFFSYSLQHGKLGSRQLSSVSLRLNMLGSQVFKLILISNESQMKWISNEYQMNIDYMNMNIRKKEITIWN